MKRMIGLALAFGLAVMVAGCASSGGGTSAGAAPQAAASGGEAGAPTGANAASGGGYIRNFNLAVKCPGIHWEKTHGWTEAQIIQQEAIDPGDIAACEQWVAAQPKGYVPPPPAGFAPSKKAPAAAPSPGASGGSPS
jgi:hypothetical protein